MASDDKDVNLQVAEEISKPECSVGSKTTESSSSGSSSPATNTQIENGATQEAQLEKTSATDRPESSSSPASSDSCSRLEPSTEMDTSEAKTKDTTGSESQAVRPSSASSPDSTTTTTTAAAAAAAAVPEDKIAFKVIFNRKKYDVELPPSSTIQDLKQHLAPMIDVIPSMQKVMIKGLAGNEKTLAELGVTRTTKVLVVGSKFDEVITVKVDKLSAGESSSTSSTASSSSSSLSAQKIHQKVLEKGPPDDVHPGIKNRTDPLPPHPIAGMLNKHGGKVRLTFKLELDQVWIGTKQRTEKINMTSVRSVVSEPIVGREEYHIMGLQLGPTEASRYWLYWVPAQYVRAIRGAILGVAGF